MAKKKSQDDLEVEQDFDPVGSEGFVEEYLIAPTYDEDGVQATSGIGLDGKEYPDPVPMAPPIGYSAPPDLMSMMRAMLKEERYVQALQDEGWDTMEEAGDFDIEDDPLPPLTLHEAILQPPPNAEPAEGSAPPTTAPSPVPEAPAAPPAPREGAVASPPPVAAAPPQSPPTGTSST